jgi:hypothetical protein
MRERVNVILLPFKDSSVEAIRQSNSIWDINYPWGSERYWGSPSEVRARIKQRMSKYDNYEAGDKHD